MHNSGIHLKTLCPIHAMNSLSSPYQVKYYLRILLHFWAALRHQTLIQHLSWFQNDVPFHFESVQQNKSTNQLLANLTSPFGNINLSSCSHFGSQQPSLEARSKDYETKVDS
ncbi:hypothetical protein ACH5RR_041224 [Cinchona calisaya]|uniref:Uncharacterized protein n=1 Tax=Cinchona calisaya TaxID=153742 RepID=A0ABD2XT83_9GENT